jgi:hypothetical protein
MSTITDPPRQPSYSKPFVPLDVAEHVQTIEWHDDIYYRFTCTCTFTSAWWQVRLHPNPETSRLNRRGCPYDPTVRALMTLQFSSGGMFDAVPVDYLIHLVRHSNMGTPGPTLCGIDRFAKGSAGWSRGGGVTGPTIVLAPCDGCAAAARADFPGLPVSGSVGGKQMAAHLDVPVSTFPW